MTEKIERKIEGEPHFITSDDGICFNIVTEVEYVPGEREWYWMTDEEKKLVLDEDIKEIPTRRLNLLVETLKDDGGIGVLIADECRKFAKLC